MSQFIDLVRLDVSAVNLPKELAESSGAVTELAQRTSSDPGFYEYVINTDWKAEKPDEYHAYRKAWVEVPEQRITLPFPLNLDIETTTRCNLSCPMCPRTDLVNEGKFTDNGFLSREDFARIIDQGVLYGAKAIKMNYLGEPLLHKDVAWQVRYAKEKGILDVLMNSNGSALTEDNARKLLEAGIDGIFISMDAANPKLYEQQRVGARLGRTIDNVYRLVQLRAKIRPSCKIRVSMVMYEGQVWRDQLQALRTMWAGLVDSVSHVDFHDRGSESLGHVYDPVEGFSCAHPFQRMVLKNNGNVTVCCNDSRDELVAGNWRTQTLKDIWDGPVFTEVRTKHAADKYYDIDMCKRCAAPFNTEQVAKRGKLVLKR